MSEQITKASPAATRLAKIGFAVVCLALRELMGGTRKESVKTFDRLWREKKI